MICIFLVLPLACALYENAHKKASSEPQDPLKQQLLDEIFEREMVKLKKWCTDVQFADAALDTCERVRYASAGCLVDLDVQCLVDLTLVSRVDHATFRDRCSRLWRKFKDNNCITDFVIDETTQKCAVVSKKDCVADKESLSVSSLAKMAGLWHARAWIASFWASAEEKKQ